MLACAAAASEATTGLAIACRISDGVARVPNA